jgi:hypothetical protein
MVINEDSDEDTMKRTWKQAPFMSLVRIADWVD